MHWCAMARSLLPHMSSAVKAAPSAGTVHHKCGEGLTCALLHLLLAYFPTMCLLCAKQMVS